jgi:2',3'-cyclic-nucleotide 2'-phosphodiesterase/3'-nucleotidase
MLAAVLALAACARLPVPPAPAAVPDGARATLAILESTDLHSHLLGYDYYRLAAAPDLGFARMATLVRAARREFPNTLLFDDGDTIQGTPLADYQALVDPVPCDRELAIYRAMDALGYDGGSIGNHEFNYGLAFLAQVTDQPMNVAGVPVRHCKGPGFPQVLANVVGVRDGKPIYPPFAVLERRIRVRDAGGHFVDAPIRIGIIGFTPPGIMQWDKRNLEGKVRATGVVEAARKYVPALRARGVDLVIAISHGGIDDAPYSPTMENAGLYLARVPGIDVLLLGHSHVKFPDPGNPHSRFNGIAGVDNVRGFVAGKPAVMGNLWGRSLGVIELALLRRDGRWTIDADATHSEVRDVRQADGSDVAPDPAIAPLAAKVHQATIRYVSTPIGDSDFAMTTYFADAGDVSALEPVNLAQLDYARRYLAANLPQDADLPLVSVAAPFKAGFSGPGDYTDIAPGPLAIRHAADLYLYPNTLAMVKTDGAGIRAWLEKSAQRFNRIDPAQTTPQELVDRKFPSYNFDVMQGGVSYAIDITRPRGQRIVDLRYHGKPVDPRQAFIVVTNNYRASGGGHFPGLDGSNILVAAPDGNREVVIDWIRAQRHLTHAADGADRNWRFAPVATAGPVLITSASGKLALARAAGLDNVRLVRDNGDGTATYALDLSAMKPAR